MQGTIGKSVEIHRNGVKKTMMNSKKCPKDNHKVSLKCSKAAKISPNETPYKLPNVFLQRLQAKGVIVDSTNDEIIERKKKPISTTIKSYNKSRPNSKILRREHEFILSDENIFIESEASETFDDENYHLVKSIPIFDSKSMTDFDQFAAGVHAIKRRQLQFPMIQQDLLSICKEKPVQVLDTSSIPQSFVLDITRLLPSSHDETLCDICQCLSKIASPLRLALIQLTLVDPNKSLFDVQLSMQWSMKGLNTKAQLLERWLFDKDANIFHNINEFIDDLLIQIHQLKSYDICWPNCMNFKARKSIIKRPLIDSSALDYLEDFEDMPVSDFQFSSSDIPSFLSKPINEWNFDNFDESIELPCANCLQELHPNDYFQLDTCNHVICRVCWTEQVEEYLGNIATYHDDQVFLNISLKCPIQDCKCYGNTGFILQFVESFLIQPFMKAKNLLKSLKDFPAHHHTMIHCPKKYCNHVLLCEDNLSEVNHIKCSCSHSTDIICCKYNQRIFTPWPFCQKTIKEQFEHVFHWPLECMNDDIGEFPEGMLKINEIRRRLYKDKRIKRLAKDFKSECQQFTNKDLFAIIDQFLLLGQSSYQLSTVDKCNSQFLTMQGDKILEEMKELVELMAAERTDQIKITTRFREKQKIVLSIVRQMECLKNCYERNCHEAYIK